MFNAKNPNFSRSKSMSIETSNLRSNFSNFKSKQTKIEIIIESPTASIDTKDLFTNSNKKNQFLLPVISNPNLTRKLSLFTKSENLNFALNNARILQNNSKHLNLESIHLGQTTPRRYSLAVPNMFHNLSSIRKDPLVGLKLDYKKKKIEQKKEAKNEKSLKKFPFLQTQAEI